MTVIRFTRLLPGIQLRLIRYESVGPAHCGNFLYLDALSSIHVLLCQSLRLVRQDRDNFIVARAHLRKRSILELPLR